jgi:hypothetical protein
MTKLKNLNSVKGVLLKVNEVKDTGLSYAIAKTLKKINNTLEEYQDNNKSIHEKFCAKGEDGKPIQYKVDVAKDGRVLGYAKDEFGKDVIAKEGEPSVTKVIDNLEEYNKAIEELDNEEFTDYHKVSLKARLEEVPDLFKKLDGIDFSLLLDTFFIDDVE